MPGRGDIRAVIFDMDGLLIDSEVIYRAAWMQSIREFQREMPEVTFRRFLGRNGRDARKMLAEIYGAEFNVEGFLDACRAFAGGHIDKHGIAAKPGLDHLLARIQERGLAKAVATSTRREWALRSLGPLANQFEILTTGDEITNGKPAPDIFLLCAERLQVEPSACLVLEDSEAGVRAAHAAGMPVIMIPDLVAATDEIRALAWKVCDSLGDVVPLL